MLLLNSVQMIYVMKLMQLRLEYGQLPILIIKYQFITGSSKWIDLPIESPLNPN